MITLDEFAQMNFLTGCDCGVTYVFDAESDWDDFCNGNRNADILFTLRSCLLPRNYLKEEYYNALVRGFVAVEKGAVAVWIDTRQQEETET